MNLIGSLSELLVMGCLLCGCHTAATKRQASVKEQLPTTARQVEAERQPGVRRPGAKIAIITNATAVITQRITTARDDATNRQPHVLNLGGGSNLSIYHAPNSTPVHIAFARWEEDDDGSTNAVFRVANSDPCAILLWNIRVEVWSEGSKNDAPGWKTLWSDYPNGPSHYNAGAVAEFEVERPTSARWRAAIIYSKEQVDMKPPKGMDKAFADDFEVIGEEIRE
jgi:hypothetical protein